MFSLLFFTLPLVGIIIKSKSKNKDIDVTIILFIKYLFIIFIINNMTHKNKNDFRHSYIVISPSLINSITAPALPLQPNFCIALLI